MLSPCIAVAKYESVVFDGDMNIDFSDDGLATLFF